MGNGSTALPISIHSQVNTQGRWQAKGGHLQVGEKLTLATGLRPWNLVRQSLESSTDSKDEEIHGVCSMIFCFMVQSPLLAQTVL